MKPQNDSPQPKRHPKTQARELVVQALYQRSMSDAPASVLIEQFKDSQHIPKAVLRLFKKYLHGVIEHEGEILAQIAPQVRATEEVHVLSLSILQLSVYELLYCFDVPYKAVINEGIELAKSFGVEEAPQFVNAVLDKLAPKIRTLECQKKLSD